MKTDNQQIILNISDEQDNNAIVLEFGRNCSSVSTVVVVVTHTVNPNVTTWFCVFKNIF